VSTFFKENPEDGLAEFPVQGCALAIPRVVPSYFRCRPSDSGSRCGSPETGAAPRVLTNSVTSDNCTLALVSGPGQQGRGSCSPGHCDQIPPPVGARVMNGDMRARSYELEQDERRHHRRALGL
jgi:hypothetical protein